MINWMEVKKAIREYQVEKSRAKRISGFSVISFFDWVKTKYGSRTKISGATSTARG